MSTGGWIGAVLGAVVGFIIGGFYGAIYGAIIGYTLGGIIDPVKPDVKQPGAPTPQGLQVMTNVIGNPIFDVLGTAKITGQLLFFGKEFNQAVWYRPSRGVRAISGYKYHASWALGICMGPTDVLYTVFRDQDPIWEGELTRPESGGEATIQIEGGGTMVFYFGTNDQVPNVNAGTLLLDPTLNTGYRHLCWAFFDAFFMNEYNRMPSMSFIIRKTPPMFDESTSQIQTYDVNPAHALWHTLINKAGLPEEWVDPVDFLAVATELFGEGRGISILFDVHQATLNYLEAINSHVDCILRYGSDGKFHPKLIRSVSPVGLPVIDKSKLLEEPTFSRRSWIDTINEVKVQYSEITAVRPAASLIGWYRLLEGEDNIVGNSVKGLPNLIIPDLGIEVFWQEEGFAYSPFTNGVWSDVCAYGETSLMVNNPGMGVFYKKAEGWGGGVTPIWNHGDVICMAAYPGYWVRKILGAGSNFFMTPVRPVIFYDFITVPEATPENVWCFIFSYYGVVGVDVGCLKIGMVRANGTLIVGSSFREALFNYQLASITLGAVDFGTYRGEGAGGTFADALIFDSFPSLADFAMMYDILRGRYGMAARNGW